MSTQTNQLQWRMEPLDGRPLTKKDAAKRWTSLELATEWADDTFRQDSRIVELRYGTT